MSDWFFKKFESQLEKNPKRTIATSWAVMFVINLAIWGVIIFALSIAFGWAFGGIVSMGSLWPL